MRKQLRLSLFIFLSVNLAGLISAYGQAGNGELTGEARDASGKIVAGAHVTLKDEGKSLPYETTTNDDRIYQFSSLRPGVYVLIVEKEYFRRFEQQGITIRTGERIRVDVALAVNDLRTT